MNIGGARAGLSEATFVAALEELQDVILAFQASVDDGVPLNPGDITQLQQVTATVMGMPSDYPDAAANTKLNEIKALLATTNSALATLHTDLDENTAEIADNGTLLEQIRDLTTPGSAATVSIFTAVTSTQLIASNSARKSLEIENATNTQLYILKGAGTASSTNRTIRLGPGDVWLISNYSGALTAVLSTTPVGQVNVTETV